MPSFDIISEIDHHELQNAIDQTKKETETRFDLKDKDLKIELVKEDITLKAPEEFVLGQLRDILENKLTKRKIDIQAFEFKDPTSTLKEWSQIIKVKNGIDQDTAKKITKLVKDKKFKAQASIQGEKVRVTGKSRDELQEVMAFFRAENVGLPLQFDNFRD